MSKYEKLWDYIKGIDADKITMTFAEIEEAGGVPIDHSFLNYKKELLEYGYRVEKISLKNQTVMFIRNME